MPTSKAACFRLRRDLLITAGDDGGFVVEDRQRGQFYRLGSAEYAVIAQLDGKTDLREAVRRTLLIPGSKTLTAESLAPWLAASGLGEAAASESGQSPLTAPKPIAARFNPCYFRVSCGAPTRWLVSLERIIGWLCSFPAVVVVALLSMVALIAVISRWELLSTPLGRVLCPDQHLALLGCWLLLKFVHELGHGIACHRLGGEVREWGLAFIYGMPVPYTDVTSSWRFSSRVDRMAVAAAGMYFEWLIALLAVAVACCTNSPALRQLGMYCLSLATVTTILFNANPLCRLDGYYILTDLIGWPNLAADGQRAISSLNRWPRGRTSIAVAYGLGAMVWRILALLTMVVVVLLAYEGLGLLLIAVVALTWYWPGASSTNAGPAQPTKNALSRLYTYGGLLVAACVLFMLAGFIPWPFSVTAPGVVESQHRHIVRARSAGQVIQLLVEDGQQVAEGQELAVLQNEELTFELTRLESLHAQGEGRLRSLHTKRQLVDFQVEQQRQETLAAQIAEQRRKIESLTIRAPAAGRVTARRLADLPGNYLAEGAELCSIVEPGREFRFSIAERDLPNFTAHLGKPIEIRLPSGGVAGTLTNLEPQASTELPDPALGAHAGGPLAVTPGTANREAKQPPSDWRLVEPRVTGTATLPDTADGSLFAGQSGSVALATSDRTIKTVLQSWGASWLQRLQKRAAAE